MASIIKRKKNYSIVYTYVDENGETKQKWETRTSYQEALKRKAEIESQKSSNSFLPPTNQNIAEFLSDFVSLYGEKRWGVSMYDSQNSLIANYINPIIGDMKVQDITTRVVDKYIQTLQKTPAVNTRTHHAKTEFVTNATIEKIIKLLRCAFKQAVRWELVAKNPFDNVVLPKVEYKKRDIWTADMIRTALDQCTDSKLYVAMNLAFACSLRMGEILGLTWSNVHISDEDIADDNAYVYIDKELARASKRAIEMLGQKDIYHVFTPLFPNTSTRIILKKPKTDSSIRKVWLPKTLAYILREWKSAQDELRALLRDEYQDYDLVVALANGRPCEDRIILKSFEKLREKAGLPKVVFHSLRHSSTTYKLKLNHGDLKATQGDTGHAQIDMITSVYAHILDEDRKINAQKFESAFYANPDLRSVRPPGRTKGIGSRHIGFGGPGGTASQVAGTGQHTGRIAGVGPIRKIGRENRISKSAFFISKVGKIVRSQLAGIQRKMYKIVPAKRQKRSDETITKNRCKPSKNGLQRSLFGTPGWVRTSGLSLRSRPDTTSGSGI